jgi:hypothetical protein
MAAPGQISSRWRAANSSGSTPEAITRSIVRSLYLARIREVISDSTSPPKRIVSTSS